MNKKAPKGLGKTAVKVGGAAASADGHFADVQMDAVLDALELADLTAS